MVDDIAHRKARDEVVRAAVHVADHFVQTDGGHYYIAIEDADNLIEAVQRMVTTGDGEGGT